jgi:hypothetical protein
MRPILEEKLNPISSEGVLNTRVLYHSYSLDNEVFEK